MSIESARAFYQRMTTDETFRASFEEALTEEESQQLMKSVGYDFTADEWKQAVMEIQTASSDKELQEEELEAIAGGKGVNLFDDNSKKSLSDLIREEIVKANTIRFRPY